MAVHGLLRLKQAKQNKTNNSLTLEADTGPREGLLPSQLQPKTGAKIRAQVSEQSATKCPGLRCVTKCPRADGYTHFYMECDVTLAVYIRMLRAQWRESL